MAAVSRCENISFGLKLIAKIMDANLLTVYDNKRICIFHIIGKLKFIFVKCNIIISPGVFRVEGE